MKPHAVLVDVSIDQGGCFETSRPTTHSDPTYEVDGITHYCVTNMPGAVPITSTYALTNATLPYVIELAERGVEEALERNPGPGHGPERGRAARSPIRRWRRRWDRRAGGAVTAACVRVQRASDDERRVAIVITGAQTATDDPPSLRRSTMASTTETLSNFIDGERVALERRDRSDPQPGDGRGAGTGADLQRGGRRPRGAAPPAARSTAGRRRPPPSARRRCWRSRT